jgi:hypothetical protein
MRPPRGETLKKHPTAVGVLSPRCARTSLPARVPMHVGVPPSHLARAALRRRLAGRCVPEALRRRGIRRVERPLPAWGDNNTLMDGRTPVKLMAMKTRRSGKLCGDGEGLRRGCRNRYDCAGVIICIFYLPRRDQQRCLTGQDGRDTGGKRAWDVTTRPDRGTAAICHTYGAQESPQD